MKYKFFAALLPLLIFNGCSIVNEDVTDVFLTTEYTVSDISSEIITSAVTETISETVTKTEAISKETTYPQTSEPVSQEITESTIMVNDISLSTYEVSLKIGQSKMPIVAMYPENASDKSEIWISSDESIAKVNELGDITAVSEGECTVTVYSAANRDIYAEVAVTVSAETGITYIDDILIVNKTYSLPEDYAPRVNPEAQAAFDEMQSAAYSEGLNIYISSAYRSYEYQSGLYQRYVDRDGQAAADRYSARPGHSEHQTGLAFDLNTIDSSFADTDEGKWVAEHCHEYGFIIRYPNGKEDITGFIYEPWHIRYLGKEKAAAVYESGLTLEEYLGIDSVYSE